jgi:uncharacterized membrane protein (UPF0182 family)
MEPTLKKAIAALFGQTQATPRPVDAMTGELLPAPTATALPETLEQASDSFERAQSALEKRDWEEFGRAMGELQKVLQQEEKPVP